MSAAWGPLRTRAPRLRAVVAAAAVLVALLPGLSLAPSAAAAAPRTPTFAPGIDAPADYQGQVLCSPTPKVGARKLAALLVATYGPASIGISRSCSVGGTSEHKEGRALDWMLNSKVASQKAKVTAFLTWLLAPDAAGNPAAMARRLGVMYLGWNNHFWGSYDLGSGWTDLKGCSTDPAKKASSYDTYCHRNHLHISLSWDGASALTSFWTGAPLPEACTAPWGSAAAGAGAGTDLVPVEPTRVLATGAGTGLDAPCRLAAPPGWDPSRHDLVVHVAGVGVIPAEGVAAVAVRVAVTRTSAPTPTVSVGTTAGSVFVPVVTSLTSVTYAGTTVVPVAEDGTIRVRVDRGAADVTIDVLAYSLVVPPPVPTPTPPPVPTPTPTDVIPTGVTHVTPTTVVYAGTGAPLAPGEIRTVSLAGVGGIPASGLAGLDLTLTAGTTTVSGIVGITASPTRPYLGYVRTSTLLTRSTQVVVPTTTGQVTLRNTGTRPVTVKLELRGWISSAPDTLGAQLTVLGAPSSVVNSLAKVGLPGAVTSPAWRFAKVTGAAVPVGAHAVLLSVSVRGGLTDSTLILGSSTVVSAVSFVHSQWSHEVVLMPLGIDGRIAIRTTSLGAQVRISVLGYVA